MQPSAAAEAAEILAQARRSGLNIDGLPSNLQPQTLDDAYQIQNALIPLIEELSNGRRLGYKGGATAEAPQKLLGLDHPFLGVLVSSYMLKSGDTIPAAACKAKLLEVEFAFRMAEDLPPAAAPYDVGGVLAAVGSFITSIEVVDLRYTGGMAAGGLQVIADNSAAGFWLAGAEFEDLDAVDFEDFPVTLHINGKLAAEGNSANVLGNPLNSLTWLANTLCQQGSGLKAGEIITAGSCIAPTPAQAGDEAVADFGELGKVTVRFGT
ncbi:MAG: fumarylacetoacetate hydrolase family protein [Alphaproteobacteria bacterium]|nr:fumarylacetoacetate hydrolase family protein [Alphaproteobacteria bacterium]MBL6953184.1 fumarylacetoacetate hydrolase family protein [Alphaproteobacteria bacterium]